jgi:LPS export ABC transporter protein LptC
VNSKFLNLQSLNPNIALLQLFWLMKRLKLAILISMVLIGGFVLVNLWVNLRERRTSEVGEDPAKISTGGASSRLERVHFVQEKLGRKAWELEATSVQQYEDRDMIVLKDVKVTFFEKDGRTFVISGNEGKLYQNSKDVELTGNVVLTSNDGYSLKTRSIRYSQKERTVRTSDPVTIKGEQIQLIGRGMVVDMEAKTFKVLHQVKTQWKGGREG